MPWFIYGSFDEFDGVRSLAAMAFFLGRSTPFEIQRGWMINDDGSKMKIKEEKEVTMGETGCTILFAQNVLKITCAPFTVYYDGMMSAHIEYTSKTTQVGTAKGMFNIGLCFDNQSGRRPNWQVNTIATCSVTPGAQKFCNGASPTFCNNLPDRGDAYRQACNQMFCDKKQSSGSNDLSDKQKCALSVSAAAKRNLQGFSSGYPSSGCPSDNCTWKHSVIESGCFQDPFFVGCN